MCIACLQIVLPRMLHVPLAVLGDWYVMKLGAHVFGMKTGKCAVSLTSMLPLCICVCVYVKMSLTTSKHVKCPQLKFQPVVM